MLYIEISAALEQCLQKMQIKDNISWLKGVYEAFHFMDFQKLNIEVHTQGPP